MRNSGPQCVCEKLIANERAASAGDATWASAFHPSTAWTNAGGDHSSTASASLFLDNNTVGNSFTWLSTTQLIADVQGWLDHPGTNFGWEVINADETSVRRRSDRA